MRDRNQLTYQQFNIQLERVITSRLQEFGTRRNYFSQELSFEFRPSVLHEEPRVLVPRNFRLLQILCIIHWYLPESLQFLVHLELEGESFSWLNRNQQKILHLMLNSKRDMISFLYLTQRFTGNEIFGNLLGNDFRELSRKFKVTWKKYPRPIRKVWRRGPKDKGSRRVNSLGSSFEDDLRRDVFLKLEEEELTRKKILLQSTINRLLSILEKERQRLEET